MRTAKPMKMKTIPAWATDGAQRDRYTVAAAFQLADLTGRWVRLSADSQRAVFGLVLFGKCQMYVGDNGIRVIRSVCFGTDFSETRFDWADVEKYMAKGCKPVI